MSLKTIRENYTNLLDTFAKSGIALNESQKGNIDNFILALESKVNDVKRATIKATKKVVSEHLEREYKQVFESIMKHWAENSELAGKIQNKIQSINESKKMSQSVGNFLDMYVESVLPKKTIVDYDRMQKLENLHESLKELLVVNEDAIESKKAQLTKSFAQTKSDLETQIAKLQVKLNESMKKELALNKKLDIAKAQVLLESKTEDLPAVEAKQIKERLAGSTCDEVEDKFEKVAEAVKDEIAAETEKEERCLEDEVADIIENDMLQGRKHNAHIDESDSEDVSKETDETSKETNEDEIEEDDIVLDESEKLDASWMQGIIDRCANITTKGY